MVWPATGLELMDKTILFALAPLLPPMVPTKALPVVKIAPAEVNSELAPGSAVCVVHAAEGPVVVHKLVPLPRDPEVRKASRAARWAGVAAEYEPRIPLSLPVTLILAIVGLEGVMVNKILALAIELCSATTNSTGKIISRMLICSVYCWVCL
jgi:hypothetical protein